MFCRRAGGARGRWGGRYGPVPPALAVLYTRRSSSPLSTLPAPSRLPSRSLELLDLSIFKLDRSGPTENRHSDLEPRALLVDLFDEPVERSERPVGDAHLLADFEGDRRLWPLHAFLHLLQDATRFLLADGDRLVLGAEKPGHLRRALDQMIGLIVELHLDQHVTRKELSLRRNLAAAAHLHDFFHRHKHLFDLVGEPGSSCTLLD